MNNLNRAKTLIKESMQLAWGTLLAQLVGFLALPILSRIYSPADFASFAIFFTSGQIIGLVLAGRYEQSFLVATSEKTANQLILICFALALILGTLLSIFLALTNGQIDEMAGTSLGLGLSVIAGYAATISVTNTLTSIALKDSRLNAISLSRFSRALTSSIAQAVFGFLGLVSTNGLIVGEIFATLLAATFLRPSLARMNALKLEARNSKSGQVFNLLWEFREYPLVNAPHVLLNGAFGWLLIVMISIYFTTNDAGQFFLMQRVAMVPVALLGTSMSQVFLKSGAEFVRGQGNFSFPFLYSALSSAAIGIPVALVLYFAGGPIFSGLLGSNWSKAGQLAQVFAPYVGFHFVLATLAPSVQLSKHMKEAFILNMLQNGAFLLAFLYNASNASVIELSLSRSIYLTLPVMAFIVFRYWLWSREVQNHALSERHGELP